MSEKTKKSKLFSWQYWLHDFVKLTAAPGLLYYRPKVIYTDPASRRELKKGALLISNHVGFSDPIYLQMAIWYRRHHFVCTKEFFEGRFRGWLFKRFLCIPIDRENMSMSSFREITGHLEAGDLVTLFPEGHVNTDATKTDAFKPGMVLMTLKSGRPIIPVYIRRRTSIWERLTVVVGPPVNAGAELGGRPSMTKITEFTQRLHELEEDLKNTANRRQ